MTEAHNHKATPDFEYAEGLGPMQLRAYQPPTLDPEVPSTSLSDLDTFPTRPAIAGPSGIIWDRLPMEVTELLRSLTTRADLKVLVTELTMEIHKESQAIGRWLDRRHGKVEAGEVVSRAMQTRLTDIERQRGWR